MHSGALQPVGVHPRSQQVESFTLSLVNGVPSRLSNRPASVRS